MANKPADKSSKQHNPKCKDKESGGSTKDAAAKSKPKFIMRNAHIQKSLQNIYVAVGVALTGAFTFWLFHNRRRRSIYKQFYENYDAEEAYNRMVDGGWLSSYEDSDDDKKKKK